MYRDKLIYGLMAVSAFFAACSDDFGDTTGPKNPIVDGDEILFGATDLATFDDGFTDGVKEGRTVYGDANYSGGAWHYPLNWVVGDEVSIYSPDATFPNQAEGYADYVIAGVDEEGNPVGDGDTISDNTNAYLKRVGDNGLHWNGLDKTYKFYAFYPSKVVKDDKNFKEGLVHGYVPKRQPMAKWTYDEVNKEWVGTPDMNLAFMRGYAEVNPSNLSNGSPVKLEFSPLTTAIEITLKGSDDMPDQVELMQAHIRGINKEGNQKQAICGTFTYDIDKDITTERNHAAFENSHEITVPLWRKGDDGNQVPLIIKRGESIRFTVFLLPDKSGDITDGSGQVIGEDRTLTNLQVEIPGWNGGTSIKTYNGVEIKKGTKSQIVLPKYNPTGTVNNWMSRIPENVYVSQLTIPGTTDAFSGEVIANKGSYNANSDEDHTQMLTVEQQFNKGVRGFEIGTEVAYNRAGGASIPNVITSGWFAGNFADAPLVCGNTIDVNNDRRFSKRLQDLAGLLAKNPSEFIVVNMYYVPKGTTVNIGQPAWIKQLSTYMNDISWKVSTSDGGSVAIVSYDNAMTVKDARGKILLLVRTNGEGDDVADLSGKVTVIKGWSSNKDRWKRRGYDTNTDAFLTGDRVGQWDGTSPISKTLPVDWVYPVKAPTTPPTVYVQEWKRVCPKTASYAHAGGGPTKWDASIGEKKTNITDLMSAAVNNLKSDTEGKFIYINSMGGYYIVDNSSSPSGAPNSSVYGSYGRTGNIASYTSVINSYIYNYVLNIPYAQRGPLGIVYMNYAGVQQDTWSNLQMNGDYLLKSLIGNNFSFELLGKPENNGTPSTGN